MLDALLVGLALAMDAAAVSAGIATSQRAWRPVVVSALSFGAFQAGMAGLGWWGGDWLTRWAAAWDHWIAFTLLVGLGGRMVWLALHGDPDAEPAGAAALTPATLLMLSVATSIDAAAAGISLPLLPIDGRVAVAMIGVVTVACCLVAGAVGRWLTRIGPRLEVAGGAVLVLLGFKILAEHLGIFNA